MPFEIPPFMSTQRLPGPQPVPVPGVRVPDPPLQSIAVAASGGEALARGGESLARLASHAREWASEQALAQASQVVAETAGELGRRFYDRQAQAPDGAEGFADGFRTDALDLINQRVGQLPGMAQQFARNRLLGHYSSWVDTAWRYEAGARREWQIRTTGRTLDALSGNVRADPASLDGAITDAEAAIAGSGLGPRDRTMLMERTRQGLAFTALREMARTDPAAARAALDGPQGQLLDDRHRQAVERVIGGAPARRSAAVATGEREVNSVRLAAEEGARQSIQQQQYQAGAEGMRLLASGGLTAAWLDGNRANLSRPDAVVLGQAIDATAPHATDDPTAVAELHDAIDDGDPYAFSSNAARMVLGGRLTPQTYAAMVQRNRNAATMWSAAGAQTVRNVRDRLRPPATGPMAQVIDQERTAAIQEMAAWAEQHQQATPAEFQAQGDAVEQRARGRMWQRIAPALPALPGFAPTREAAQLADVDGFERSTVQQMDRREISPTEALRRLRASRQWRAALPLRPGAPARRQESQQ